MAVRLSGTSFCFRQMPHRRGYNKKHFDTLDLCTHAADVLKKAGFEVAYVSRRSEAVYFKFPERHGLLRVSAHKHSGSRIGQEKVITTLTFTGNHHTGKDTLVCSEGAIETRITCAIGRYMIKSMEPQISLYKGKKGTWEDANDIRSYGKEITSKA